LTDRSTTENFGGDLAIETKKSSDETGCSCANDFPSYGKTLLGLFLKVMY